MASYIFYASWDPRFLTLILLSTLVDYAAGLGMANASSARRKKVWLASSLVVNLGALALFKYFNFFIGSFRELLSAIGFNIQPAQWLSECLDIPLIPGTQLLDIILPLGISFYTFQTMSYSLDVYRGKLTPIRDIVRFALFVSFFPQLIAGPIVRAVEFLPQLTGKVHATWDDTSAGLHRFLIGLGKKVIIADNLAPFVDTIYRDAGAYDGPTMWLAAIGFSVQVYCDFSGYSDMAIGAARMFGFRLPENFRFPFAATNVAEFWRRWHITLYSFMRDYLYIMTLGGSRVGTKRLLFNVLATMTLVGLWHGAGWQFLLWGFANGVLVLASRTVTGLLEKAPRTARILRTAPGTALCIAATSLSFVFTCGVFRSESIGDAFCSMGRMLLLDNGGGSRFSVWVLAAFGLVLLANQGAERRLGEKLRAIVPWPVASLGYAVLIAAIIVLGPVDVQAFVYFQF